MLSIENVSGATLDPTALNPPTPANPTTTNHHPHHTVTPPRRLGA